MISGDGCGLSFPEICLTVEENLGKNLNQENRPDRGSDPGPLGEKQRCYPLTTAVVICNQNLSNFLNRSSIHLTYLITMIFCRPIIFPYNVSKLGFISRCVISFIIRIFNSETQKNSNQMGRPGGPVVVILATGSEVRGFKPGRGRWIFSERKNLEFDFLRKRSKAVGPMS